MNYLVVLQRYVSLPVLIGFVLVQLALCIHAGRTGRLQPWAWLIMVLPGLGGLLYVLTQMVPDWLTTFRAQRARRAMADAVDPGRHYRAMKEAVATQPTVANQLRLARACQQLGRHREAIKVIEPCLVGIHAEDTSLLSALAESRYAMGDMPGALDAFQRQLAIVPRHATFDLHLTYAKALEQAGQTEAALAEYAILANRYPGEEARFRYGALLKATGRHPEAQAVFASIVTDFRRRRGADRKAQRPWEAKARRMMR